MTLEIIKSLLAEMQARIEHPLPAMRPFEVAFKDPLPREVRAKQFGTICKVTFEIDPELYRQIQHGLPEQAILKGVLWMEDIPVAPLPKKAAKQLNSTVAKQLKPAKDHGDYGDFWQILFKDCRLADREDVREWLNVAEPREVKLALYRIFTLHHETGSLSTVAPETARDMFREQGLASLVTVCENAMTAWKREAKDNNARG